MIGAAQIALLCIGLYLLTAGKSKTGKRVLRGAPARVVGLVFMLPVPLAFMIGIGIGINLGLRHKPFRPEEWKGTSLAIEAVAVVVCLVAGCVIARVYSKPLKKRRPKTVEPA